MAKRITGNPPRLVQKPFYGEPQTEASQRAEAVKFELQTFLHRLSEASDSAQEAIEDLETTVTAGGISSQASLHLFLLMGA